MTHFEFATKAKYYGASYVYRKSAGAVFENHTSTVSVELSQQQLEAITPGELDALFAGASMQVL